MTHATQLQTRAFLNLSPDIAIQFIRTLWMHPAHLPLSHPFCSSSTYLPRTLPKVASQAENLM